MGATLGWHPPKGAETAERCWGRLRQSQDAGGGGDTQKVPFPQPGGRSGHCHSSVPSAGSQGHRQCHTTARDTRWHLALDKRARGAARFPNSLRDLNASGERRAGLRTAQLGAAMAAVPPAKKGWKPRGCPDRRLRRWAPQPSSAPWDGAVPLKAGGRAGGARGVPDPRPRCPKVGTGRVNLLPAPPVLKTGITPKAGTAFCCAEPPRQTPAAQSHPPQQAAPRQAGGRQAAGRARAMP